MTLRPLKIGRGASRTAFPRRACGTITSPSCDAREGEERYPDYRATLRVGMPFWTLCVLYVALRATLGFYDVS
ncbi:hypothetical protein C6381_12295 [Pseudomonas syringae pv. actinidiae]|nr:hypothetical protein C6381_12295 [Pseudomonas syringae pv. actinidiae]